MAELDVQKLLDDHPSRFEPLPFYSPDGDSVQFYMENVDYYAERVDCWLTVYKAFDDHRVIGFKLKNIGALSSRFDQLGLTCIVSRTTKKWSIMLQPVIACIPMVVETTLQTDPYRNLLASFGSRLREPFEVAQCH